MESGLSVRNLSKSFKGIHALIDASLDFYPGEVHALLGENGAGKSTLCKMLSGALEPDSGEIVIDGQTHSYMTPFSAKACGVGMIYQEFNLVQEMTVYENLYLGKEIRKGIHVDRAAMIKGSNEVFGRLGIEINPNEKIKNLSVAYCQLVEIGKAVLENAKYLILDEPTAPLTNNEVEALFRLVRELKKQNITIIYISHRLEELFEISDKITIMRDGQVITTLMTPETNRNELIKLMVGREINSEFPPIVPKDKLGEEVLRVEHLNTSKVKDISFSLHKGEILGIAGLVGAGRTEVLRAIFGADVMESGDVWVHGKKVIINTPEDAVKYGIGMVPEDRKRQAVHLDLAIGTNISLIKIKNLSRFFTISGKKEKNLINRFVNALSIKMGSSGDPVSSLSGGNQQKVVVSKWLSTESDILFFDEPTRGIDVGAKKEIYDLLDNLRSQDKGIVVVSSEMLEVIGLCDRILVMHEGDMMGELSNAEATQEKILQLASGGEAE